MTSFREKKQSQSEDRHERGAANRSESKGGIQLEGDEGTSEVRVMIPPWSSRIERIWQY